MKNKLMTLLLAVVQLILLLSCQQRKIKQPFKTIRDEKVLGKLGAIHIIPLGKVRKRFIKDVIDGLQSFYHQEIIVESAVLLTEDLLAPSRTRYNANKILNKFNSTKDILIITEKDISTFKGIKMPEKFYNAPVKGITKEWGIFGLGLRPGNVCVISAFEKRLGKNATSKLLKERLQKIAIHEVGHNKGLEHCTKNTECLMHAADGSIKQVDNEKLFFCDNCRKIIGM
jgi:archaemetzincin